MALEELAVCLLLSPLEASMEPFLQTQELGLVRVLSLCLSSQLLELQGSASLRGHVTKIPAPCRLGERKQ